MTRLEQIFQEIAEHVKWTGNLILADDGYKSIPPTISWVAIGKDVLTKRSWSISLNQLGRDTHSSFDEEKRKLILEDLTTSSGRIRIAASFPGQRKGSNDPPTFECAVCGSETWLPGYLPDQHSKEECDKRLASNVMES